MIELTVLGCAGGYPAPAYGAASGYLLRSGGTAIWVDCGSGTFAALQRHLVTSDLAGVVITHRHPDHCVDLLGLRVHLLYDLGRAGVPVLAPAEVRERLEGLWDGDDDTFAWDEVGDRDQRTLGDFTFRFSRTDHPVPTVALDARAGGKRLVYTSDTGPGWSVGEFDARADLVLSEASYQSGAEGAPLHLTAAQAAEGARAAAARRLMITHLWPTLDPAASVAEAEEAFGARVTLAAPDLRVRI